MEAVDKRVAFRREKMNVGRLLQLRLFQESLLRIRQEILQEIGDSR